MIVKLLTEHDLEFLSLKGGCTGCPSIHLSKCHMVGNLMHRLLFDKFQNQMNWLNYCSDARLTLRRIMR